MIVFDAFASGSSGNLYRVKNGDSALLIEAGVSIKRIRRALDYKVSELVGALITHLHKDHCGAVKDLLKAGIDCYMTAETAAAIKCDGHRLHIIEPKKQFTVGPWTVLPFETEHDTPGAVGFLVSDGTDKLLFATDTFFVRYKFQGLTHIAVECNYSLDTLDPEINQARKERLYKSHFSLENVKKFLQANDLSQVREIHLIHMSKDNSDPELFKEEIQKLTGKPVYCAKERS